MVKTLETVVLPPRNVVLPPGNTAKYHAYTHTPSGGLITDCGKFVTNLWRMFIKDRLGKNPRRKTRKHSEQSSEPSSGMTVAQGGLCACS